jgi:polyisoprenyl-teichoic acid--peptidoglycan teichoic acid transferase
MRRLIPRSRTGTAWRFIVAAILVIGASAATTAVAGLLQVSTLVSDLTFKGNGIRIKGISLPKPGQPQTILLIGSDHRVGTTTRESHTDTMLLVRLNANSSTINVMSIPRDLQVQIPGYGIDKINAAYTDGGYSLLLKTIKANVFPNLHVNHIVDTNFTGFSDLVDAIGCVYSDVDHRYYNNTLYTNYSSIDVQPGYEKLCGDNQAVNGALPFVRFRHTDTDIVREARQQDFIRWAKAQYPISKLFANRNRLLTIFGKHSTLDRTLQSEDGLINLFNLVLGADGSTIKQIPFPADLQPCTATSCFVTAEQSRESEVFARFMAATKKAKTASAKATPKSAKGHQKLAKINLAGLTEALPDGHSQAAQLTKVTMPVYFPRYIVSGSNYCLSLVGNCTPGDEPASEYAHSYPRQYLIRDSSGHPHAAYRMTIEINSVKGQYYGVQGIAWRNPPLLQSPSGTRTLGGRKLFLYANGGRLTTVAWHQGPNTYWISNTLTSDIGNGQMVAMAASMIRARG